MSAKILERLRKKALDLVMDNIFVIQENFLLFAIV